MPAGHSVTLDSLILDLTLRERIGGVTIMSSTGEEHSEPSPSGGGAARQDIGSKLFLGGLSWNTSEEKLHEHFKQYGSLAEVVVMRDKMTARPRGFGFVTFERPESAEKAVKEVHVVDGRQIDVKKSVPQEGKPKACKVFVGGLSPETTEEHFKTYFSKFGEIAEVQIMQDHMSGRSRGFGFVTFEEDSSAEKVFEIGNMHDIGGKRVEVKPATPKGSGSQQGARSQPPRGRSSAEYDPLMMRPYASGVPGVGPYAAYPMYSYAPGGPRPGMMAAYGNTMQYPPQYMMMPPPQGMPSYAPYQQPYGGPGRGGAVQSSTMPFTPPSPQGMVPQHHPFSSGLYQSSSSPSPSPPYRTPSSGGMAHSKSRTKVDSASSLDAAHAERQLKRLSLQ